jgi:hypothetical protein
MTIKVETIITINDDNKVTSEQHITFDKEVNNDLDRTRKAIVATFNDELDFRIARTIVDIIDQVQS